MADLIYMSKQAWESILNAVRGKTGKTGLLKAGDIPGELSDLFTVGDFLNGTNITKVSDSEIETIRAYCFYEFSDLQEVDIPAVKRIEEEAFLGCTSLKSCNMPSVERIGDYAFSFGPVFNNIYLPKATVIGHYAFTFSDYWHPSTGKGSTGKLTIGNMSSIGILAFDHNDLSEIDITVHPSGGTIQTQAFSDNANLTKVTIRGTAMATLEDAYEFYNTPIDSLNGEIFVDASMVDTYKTATNWSKYASIIKAIS